MDPNPAQPIEEVPAPSVSPVKKFLPFILGGVLVLLLIFGSLILFSPASKGKKAAVSPTPRPTATPFPPPPTLPMATKAVSNISTTISPVAIGRLAFIKNGDIYNSDLTSFSLLVKNATGAADKLSWSPNGNFLSWRAVSLGTPSAITIYNRTDKSAFTIKPSNETNTELIDYAWSLDEKNIAILYRDKSYHIDLISNLTSGSTQLLSLLTRTGNIRQIVWPERNTIIFSGEDGINSLDIKNPTPKLLVDNSGVLRMKLSGDKKKLLYSVGTEKKSDLFIMNVDGSGSQLIPAVPDKVDMGSTNIQPAVLNNGFIPYAIWFPKGDKLLAAYHDLPNLPLVGIYDLPNNSFTALSAVPIYENDFMTDDLRLAGERINTFSETPTWQVTFFTIEDNAKLSTIRVIPDASSPAFFGQDLLPSGNTF